MLRSEIRTESRRLLNDTASVLFTDATLNSWIDLANIDLAQRMELDTAMATITTVASEPNYQLPADSGGIPVFSSLKEVYFNQSGNGERRLKVISQDELNDLYGAGWREDVAGEPAVAYMADYNVVGLHPKPDSTNASRTLRVFYYRMPSAMSDGSIPAFIAALHDALTMFAVARGFGLLGKLDNEAFYWKKYEELVRRFKHNQQKFSDDMLTWRWG